MDYPLQHLVTILAAYAPPDSTPGYLRTEDVSLAQERFLQWNTTVRWNNLSVWIKNQGLVGPPLVPLERQILRLLNNGSISYPTNPQTTADTTSSANGHAEDPYHQITALPQSDSSNLWFYLVVKDERDSTTVIWQAITYVPKQACYRGILGIERNVPFLVILDLLKSLVDERSTETTTVENTALSWSHDLKAFSILLAQGVDVCGELNPRSPALTRLAIVEFASLTGADRVTVQGAQLMARGAPVSGLRVPLRGGFAEGGECGILQLVLSPMKTRVSEPWITWVFLTDPDHV